MTYLEQVQEMLPWVKLNWQFGVYLGVMASLVVFFVWSAKGDRQP